MSKAEHFAASEAIEEFVNNAPPSRKTITVLKGPIDEIFRPDRTLAIFPNSHNSQNWAAYIRGPADPIKIKTQLLHAICNLQVDQDRIPSTATNNTRLSAKLHRWSIINHYPFMILQHGHSKNSAIEMYRLITIRGIMPQVALREIQHHARVMLVTE